MPDYTADEVKTEKGPCGGIKMDLTACIMNSDCVLKAKKSPKQCLRTHDPLVPQECFSLWNLFFECKRSLLDNRQRFRGHKGY